LLVSVCAPDRPDHAFTEIWSKTSNSRGLMMKPEQIVLPLKQIKRETRETAEQANADLVGRSFFDGSTAITVTGVSHTNPRQVVVRRDADGKSWSVPAGLIRLIVGRKKRRRAA
jgi:hypothetical protein